MLDKLPFKNVKYKYSTNSSTIIKYFSWNKITSSQITIIYRKADATFFKNS